MAKRKPAKVPEISDEQRIVNRCNELARDFYAMVGYRVSEGYRFDQATHPQERGMWNLAVYAFDFIEGTDVDDCLNQVNDE